MSSELEQLKAGIAALEAQRALLGDSVADAALNPLRARFEFLTGTEPAATAQTLKQVTILFLDVVGSTTLSQHLDPEDTHAVLDEMLARSTAIVQSHGGKVLQYAGDSLLAVFGADRAREDDPEHAVLAGLALLDESRLHAASVERRHGYAGFGVRIGLHTGSVLLGGGVDAEGSIRGIAVSIAARMEQTAPPQTLRISRDTYRHVRGLFDVQVQPQVPIKGLDDSFITYLVLRAKPRASRQVTRGVEGVCARMIGRDAELEGLRAAFRNLRRDARLNAVVVVGEAGAGKSRLLHEFESWLDGQRDGFLILRARATPRTQNHPYSLLRDIVAGWLQIDEGDSMEVAKQKVEDKIAPLFTADGFGDMASANAHVLGHLIGLDFGDSRHIRAIADDGKQMRDRAFHVAAQILRRIAARGDTSIVVLLEDLHWADDGSLDFLAHLPQVNRGVPMLILASTRPSLFERLHDWPASAGTQRIELCPLDRSASLRLAAELLKKLPEVPQALQTLVTDSAEGNPFYMEEVVNMLLDKGAIESTADQWILHPDKLLATLVPQTLVGVLQARLDDLPAEERVTLQAASVIGFVFWEQALAAIEPQSSWSLPALVQRALTLPRQDASLEGMRAYVFRHQMLHQVTYGTLLKRTRRQLHGKVAEWLANLANARSNELLGAIAEHYEQSGNGEQAAEFFARAAEHAGERYAHQATLAHAGRGLELIAGGTLHGDLELRWRLLDARERTFDVQGKRDAQRADLDAMQVLAEALDDDRRRGDVRLRRARLAFLADDLHAAETAARQAMEFAARSGHETLRLRAQGRLAVVIACLGDPASGKALAQDGLAQAQRAQLPRVQAGLLSHLAYIASLQEDVTASSEVVRQRLALARELGDRASECSALCDDGFSRFELGDYTGARRSLDEALRLARKLGDRRLEGFALKVMSNAALSQGEAQEALALARAALDIAQQTQSHEDEASALCSLGNAELALANHAAAERAFELAEDVAAKVDDPFRHDATAGRARVALDQNDQAALRHVERLLSHYYGDPKRAGAARPALIHLTCWQVLHRFGDARAAEVLGRAHVELQALAQGITDTALRQSFVDDVPEHRAIASAWAAQQGSAEKPT